MRDSLLPKDPYAPIAFPDGRVFEIQHCSAVELCYETLTYRLCLEIMEQKSQHLHFVEVLIFWGQLTTDRRRPPGEKLLYFVRDALTPELDTWRYPERKSSYNTTHRFEIGRPSEPFI